MAKHDYTPCNVCGGKMTDPSRLICVLCEHEREQWAKAEQDPAPLDDECNPIRCRYCRGDETAYACECV
jgi:hypothetical protein